MKIIQKKCTNCGATLEFESNNKIQFCNHCGTKIILEDENKTTHHEIIDKNENISNHYYDEAKIKQLDIEQKERADEKRLNLIFLIAWIASIFVFLIISFFTMDEVNFSPFQLVAIIDIIVGTVVIKKRSKR